MKINPVILLLFVFLLGCGNAEDKPDLSNTAPEKDPLEEAVDWSKLQNRNGDAYLPNTDKPFSGWAKRSYENGQFEVLAKFTNGSVTRLKQWQENGIPKWDIGYTQGKVEVKDIPIENFFFSDLPQNGPYILWYDNGQKRAEGNYKDGKLDGGFTWWHENGQMGGEEKYKDDKIVTANVWKPNGEKCPITNIVGGNGVLVFYNDDSSEYFRESYKNGEVVKD